MRTRQVVVLLLAVSLGVPRLAAAQREQMLVSSSWLAAHLHDPDLVLLHVGDSAEYAAKHIAGARFVSLQAISVSDRSDTGLVLEMPSAESLRERLARLGISDNSRVVVYYGNDWVSPSTRVVFTLDYAGLGARTSLLDGGMPAWVREGHDVTADAPTAREGRLSALHIKPIVVTAAYVRQHVGKRGVSIVDARDASFYDGIPHEMNGRPMQQRLGHVAGAKSVPFTEVTHDDLIWKSAAELGALFAKAGVQPGDTVVGYCHVGQQATAMLFAARSLGHPVLLFDGSFQQWSRLPEAEYPVEKPAPTGKP